jgi:hypothetical protein
MRVLFLEVESKGDACEGRCEHGSERQDSDEAEAH